MFTPHQTSRCHDVYGYIGTERLSAPRGPPRPIYFTPPVSVSGPWLPKVPAYPIAPVEGNPFGKTLVSTRQNSYLNYVANDADNPYQWMVWDSVQRY